MVHKLILLAIALAGFDPPPAPLPTVQVLFTGAPEVSIAEWKPDAAGAPVALGDHHACRIPGRLNLAASAIHRLKLSVIPKQEKRELFATLEVAPFLPRTETYLDNRAIEVRIEDKDIARAVAGNYLTKVICLVDPENAAKVDEVRVFSSVDLAAGVDPIIEADRAGTILAIFRFGPPK